MKNLVNPSRDHQILHLLAQNLVYMNIQNTALYEFQTVRIKIVSLHYSML